MKSCTCCNKKELLKTLAYLQLEVGLSFCGLRQLHDSCKDRMKLDCILGAPSAKGNGATELQCGLTTEINLSPNLSKIDIVGPAMPKIPQGVLILDRTALLDTYTCRFCKTLVSGRRYRGKEIKGFDEFSKHMMDIHQRIVLVRSHASEKGNNGVHWAESTEALLDIFENVQRNTSEPEALKQSKKIKDKHPCRVSAASTCLQKNRKANKSNAESLRLRIHLSSQRRKKVSQILLRKYRNYKFSTVPTQKTLTALMSNTSTQTDGDITNITFNSPPSFVDSSILESDKLTNQVSSSGEQRNSKERDSLVSNEKKMTSTEVERGIVQKSEDSDSEDDSDAVIDVGSEEEEIIPGPPNSPVLPDPDMDVDMEDANEWNVTSIGIEMDERNTVAVIPILINVEPISPEYSSAVDNKLDRQKTISENEILNVFNQEADLLSSPKANHSNLCDIESKLNLESFEVSRDLKDYFNEIIDQVVAVVDTGRENFGYKNPDCSIDETKTSHIHELSLFDITLLKPVQALDSLGAIELIEPISEAESGFKKSVPDPLMINAGEGDIGDYESNKLAPTCQNQKLLTTDKHPGQVRHRRVTYDFEDTPETLIFRKTSLGLKTRRKKSGTITLEHGNQRLSRCGKYKTCVNKSDEQDPVPKNPKPKTSMYKKVPEVLTCTNQTFLIKSLPVKVQKSVKSATVPILKANPTTSSTRQELNSKKNTKRIKLSITEVPSVTSNSKITRSRSQTSLCKGESVKLKSNSTCVAGKSRVIVTKSKDASQKKYPVRKERKILHRKCKSSNSTKTGTS